MIHVKDCQKYQDGTHYDSGRLLFKYEKTVYKMRVVFVDAGHKKKFTHMFRPFQK